MKSTIVGWHSTVGRWARLENVSVLGDDVTIADEIYVNGLSPLLDILIVRRINPSAQKYLV